MVLTVRELAAARAETDPATRVVASNLLLGTCSLADQLLQQLRVAAIVPDTVAALAAIIETTRAAQKP